MRKLSVALLIILGCAVVASARPSPPVPEIDPSSVIGVAALIGSAVVMMKQQRKK